VRWQGRRQTDLEIRMHGLLDRVESMRLLTQSLVNRMESMEQLTKEQITGVECRVSHAMVSLVHRMEYMEQLVKEQITRLDNHMDSFVNRMESMETLTQEPVAAAPAAAAASQVTPLQKVLQMLSDLQAKGKEGKHQEEMKFAEFSQFCTSTRESTQKSISPAVDQLVALESAIAKVESDAESLATEIAERAINVFNSRKEDVPQSLLQVQGVAGLPKEARATIECFLALSEGELGAPSANACEFQSGGAVGTLENLRAEVGLD